VKDLKYLFFFFLFGLCISSSNVLGNTPPEIPPKKWPCDQVYNPKFDLNAIWTGPTIEKHLKNWWKDDDVIEYVNLLSEPTLDEKEGTVLIEEFAKKYSYFGKIKKSEQKEKLVFLFSGLYQKAKDRRRRQYVGILKFVERQEGIRKAIGEASKLLRKYRKEEIDLEDPKYLEASSQLKWNTRVFDQRTRLTQYICEEPVFNTQRLGYQARKILTYLK
jgi:hypothetical protein